MTKAEIKAALVADPAYVLPANATEVEKTHYDEAKAEIADAK